MQGQLDAMNRQADISDKLLTETSNLVGHNENMVKAMQDQLAAMEWHGDIMEIQAGLFDKQVNAMQGQLAAMQSQEKALRESLDETRKAIRYSEAAYIAVTDTSLVQFGGNKVTICRMFYANTGNTPAYNVRIYGHINLWDRPLIPKDHEKLKDIGPAECSQHIICA
jgi:hypothetical protein